MTTFLTAAELAAMRSEVGYTLPDSAVISRATLASDSAGGYTETWAEVDTVDCRIDPPGNIRLDQWMDKIQNRSVFILNVAQGTDIEEGDKAVSGGVTYLVVGLLTSSWEIVKRLVVVVVP